MHERPVLDRAFVFSYGFSEPPVVFIRPLIEKVQELRPTLYFCSPTPINPKGA